MVEGAVGGALVAGGACGTGAATTVVARVVPTLLRFLCKGLTLVTGWNQLPPDV